MTGKVNKENGPSFAADTWLYVRKRFYAELAKGIAAARTAGRDPVRDQPDGHYTQKLTLENMKWLYETKIKPHVACRELFLCNGCEGGTKSFGFEAVTQYYAAKHANGKLSRGSVVVHWRSEWPDVPPFRPDPQSKGSKLTTANTHARQKHSVSQPFPPGRPATGRPTPWNKLRGDLLPGTKLFNDVGNPGTGFTATSRLRVFQSISAFGV